jgi:hypothetical protein
MHILAETMKIKSMRNQNRIYVDTFHLGKLDWYFHYSLFLFFADEVKICIFKTYHNSNVKLVVKQKGIYIRNIV